MGRSRPQGPLTSHGSPLSLLALDTSEASMNVPRAAPQKPLKQPKFITSLPAAASTKVTADRSFTTSTHYRKTTTTEGRAEVSRLLMPPGGTKPQACTGGWSPALGAEQGWHQPCLQPQALPAASQCWAELVAAPGAARDHQLPLSLHPFQQHHFGVDAVLPPEGVLSPARCPPPAAAPAAGSLQDDFSPPNC